jgi:hypothetical protein
LASGLGTPVDIELDSTNVYWVDTSSLTVATVPKAGGAVVQLAQNVTGPLHLGADAYVYFMQAGAVARAPKDGTGPTQVLLASAAVPGQFIGVDAQKLYFAPLPGAYTFESVPISGGSAQTLFDMRTVIGGNPSGISLEAVVFDGKNIWSSIYPTGEIGDYVYNGSTPVAFTNPPADYISAYDGCVYYNGCNPVSIYQPWICPAGSPFSGTCFAGSATPPVAPINKIFTGSSCALLWADAAGIQFHGYVATLLIGPGFSHVVRLVADTGSVYWTDATGAIGRLPLP